MCRLCFSCAALVAVISCGGDTQGDGDRTSVSSAAAQCELPTLSGENLEFYNALSEDFLSASQREDDDSLASSIASSFASFSPARGEAFKVDCRSGYCIGKLTVRCEMVTQAYSDLFDWLASTTVGSGCGFSIAPEFVFAIDGQEELELESFHNCD
ncbi:MAG: hypothetical protein AAF654_13030 [Myxococcota bacterium]